MIAVHVAVHDVLYLREVQYVAWTRFGFLSGIPWFLPSCYSSTGYYRATPQFAAIWNLLRQFKLTSLQ